MFEDFLHELVSLLLVEDVGELGVEEENYGPFVADVLTELSGDEGIGTAFFVAVLIRLSKLEQLHILQRCQPTPVKTDLHPNHQTHLVLMQRSTVISLRMFLKSFQITLILIELFRLKLLEPISYLLLLMLSLC